MCISTLDIYKYHHVFIYYTTNYLLFGQLENVYKIPGCTLNQLTKHHLKWYKSQPRI